MAEAGKDDTTRGRWTGDARVQSRRAPRWCTVAILLGLAALLGTAAPGAHAQIADDTGASTTEDEAAGATFSYPPPTSQDPLDLCVYYNRRGVAASRAGFYAIALDNLQQALDSGQAKANTLDHWCEFWGLHNEMSLAYASMGDYPRRIRFLLQILPLYEKKQDDLRVVAIRGALLESYRTMGLIAKMKDEAAAQTAAHDELLHRSRVPHSTVMMASAVYYQGQANYQDYFGNFSEAERARTAALQSIRDYVRWAYATQVAGSRYQNVGDRFYVDVLVGLMSDLANQGKLADAYYYATESMRHLQAVSTLQNNTGSLILQVLSDLSLMRGRWDEAQRYAEQSIEALKGGQIETYSPQLAGRRAHLALVLGVRGRWSEALRAFEDRDRGLRTRPGARSWDHMDWAMAMLKTGHADTANTMLTRMIAVHQRRVAVNPVVVAELHGYRAAALEQVNQVDAAQAEFAQALPLLVDHLRHGAQGDATGYLDKFRIHLILDAYLDHLGALARAKRTLPGLDATAEAFRIADIARGSSVQGALVSSAARATISDSRLASLAKEEQAVSSQKQSLQDVMIRLASAPAASRLDQVIADMQSDIGRLGERQSRLRKEIAQDYPDYSQLIDPRPPVPADIQRVLGEDEVCVSIYTNDTQSFVWTITRQAVSFRTAPVNQAQLGLWVAAIRQSVDLGDGVVHPFALEPAYRVYESLLKPDRALWGARQSLDVIPSGALGELPLGLLPTASAPMSGGNARVPWLIRDVAISTQPSASSLWALRTLRSRNPQAPMPVTPFIGFGNPRFNRDSVALAPGDGTRAPQVRNLAVGHAAPLPSADGPATQNSASDAGHAPTIAQAFGYLPALPDTALELQEMARVLQANADRDLLLDARASETEVKARDLTRYRVVAFATHGLTPGEIDGLDQPALALSNPALTGEKGNDGFLTLDEVLGLKLNADWVVLSACNTASAEGTSDEALSGLGRGFFYAGARSLLVSNWSVESASARMLTTGIFEQQQARPQMSRAEALRQSMLHVMTAQREYAHPAFWAPFSLAGDGFAP